MSEPPRIRMRPEARREQILQVACRLFAEQGYDVTTTREIAQVAGIAERLVFHYFSSKDAIYQELFDRWAEHSGPHAFTLIDGSPLATLQDYATRVWQAGTGRDPFNDTEHAQLIRAVHNRQGIQPAIRDVIARHDSIIDVAILPLIEQGQAMGEMREGDPKALASLFFAAVMGALQLKRDYGNIYTPPPLDLLMGILAK